MLADLPPAAIAYRGRLCGRIDDVGEEHGGEHAVEECAVGFAHHWKEPLDLRHQCFHVAGPGKVVYSVELDVPGVRDDRGEIAACADQLDPIAAAVENQRWDADRRKQRSDVHLHKDPFLRHHGARARREPPPAREPVEHPIVAGA